jgi:hypothetical protein
MGLIINRLHVILDCLFIQASTRLGSAIAPYGCDLQVNRLIIEFQVFL